MSRWEFMRALEKLLSDISPYEREEALQYYNDYFNDAGKENEQEVIKALGSPEQVAQIVRDGLVENGSQGEFTETGFTSGAVQSRNEIVKRAAGKRDEASEGAPDKESGGRDSSGQPGGQQYDDGIAQAASKGAASGDMAGGAEKKKDLPVWAIVLIVIGCILASPVILGLVGAAIGLIVSVFAAILSVLLGIGITMLVLYIVAAALLIVGFGCILPYPAAGVGLLGGGMICGALGILFMLLLVFLVGKCIPALCQGLSYIFKKLFRKKGGVRA